MFKKKKVLEVSQLICHISKAEMKLSANIIKVYSTLLLRFLVSFSLSLEMRNLTFPIQFSV